MHQQHSHRDSGSDERREWMSDFVRHCSPYVFVCVCEWCIVFVLPLAAKQTEQEKHQFQFQRWNFVVCIQFVICSVCRYALVHLPHSRVLCRVQCQPSVYTFCSLFGQYKYSVACVRSHVIHESPAAPDSNVIAKQQQQLFRIQLPQKWKKLSSKFHLRNNKSTFFS